MFGPVCGEADLMTSSSPGIESLTSVMNWSMSKFWSLSTGMSQKSMVERGVARDLSLDYLFSFGSSSRSTPGTLGFWNKNCTVAN